MSRARETQTQTMLCCVNGVIVHRGRCDGSVCSAICVMLCGIGAQAIIVNRRTNVRVTACKMCDKGTCVIVCEICDKGYVSWFAKCVIKGMCYRVCHA